MEHDIPRGPCASICCRKANRLMPKIFLERFQIDSWALSGLPGGDKDAWGDVLLSGPSIVTDQT
jgi:hypothetical protein